MPRFEYSARDDAGKSTSGEIITNTRAEAAKLLRASGKFVVKLEEAQEKTTSEAPRRGGSRRVNQTQVIYFANQLAIMVDTGVPLSDALEASIMDEPQSGFRRVVEDVIERVQSGQEFSAALAKHPRAFPRFFANIIKASEASGLLGTMLQRAAAYMTNQRDTRKRIQGAMAYPLAMIGFCILVAIFLLTYLLPKFIHIFESRGAALPAPTRILIGAPLHLLPRSPTWGPTEQRRDDEAPDLDSFGPRRMNPPPPRNYDCFSPDRHDAPPPAKTFRLAKFIRDEHRALLRSDAR
ncbi:MAG: type II secretion system F family protein [Planctomycetes bacterium]|nr:type II secretion system F family protein [Planctomycetota bacterium]